MYLPLHFYLWDLSFYDKKKKKAADVRALSKNHFKSTYFSQNGNVTEVKSFFKRE